MCEVESTPLQEYAPVTAEPVESMDEHQGGDVDEEDDAISDIDNIEYDDKAYKPSGLLDEAEDEYDLDDADAMDVDVDERYVRMGDKHIIVNDEQIGLWDYFGHEHQNYIEELYNVPPIEQPAHMTVKLHAYQLKIIAQSIWSLDSPFAGFLNGSEMGLAAVCGQWVKTINSAWMAGHGISAYHLHDSRVSAHDLLAMGFDVVVMSYDFCEHNARKMDSYRDELALHRRDSRYPKPKLPTSAIRTDMWADLDMEPKLIVLDEAQLINKPALAWAKSVARLNAKRILMMSGTLPHNQWTNIFGYMKLLKGHPFVTQREFLRVFGVPGERVTTTRKLRCLSRFLQAVTISHPSLILNLPKVEEYKVSFKLHDSEHRAVSALVQKNKKGVIGSKQVVLDGGDKERGMGSSVYADQAQLKSGHPMMGKGLKAVQALRCDGTTPSDRRPVIEEAFIAAECNIPLLMTAGSGSVGLNITSASIMIQCEPWWNRNIEKQAACRVYRQGQEEEVLIFTLVGFNNDIDMEVMTVAGRKVAVNRDLMKVLITTHDEPPKLEDLMTRPPDSGNVQDTPMSDGFDKSFTPTADSSDEDDYQSDLSEEDEDPNKLADDVPSQADEEG
ncbi:hypothetical protein DSL72_008879 [Monilinia vaccinii-corymbosi]|uniref:Helicase C-terminal domain-containing protein n=1 Tax=Monilinia vaccinii-corymbosi TaxID=61207 RepID=A0A8A3PRJ8_9HELO|nr:hypothetical protein DSL72_008879 [Monilinia vaccinii-corymbosi]